MKAIEPSEILVVGETSQAKLALASPWLRFIARCADYTLFFFILIGLRISLSIDISSTFFQRLTPIGFILWIPIEAFFLSKFRKTPGKWLLCIDLQFQNRARLDYVSSLKRSFSVWVRGLGLMIPFVNVLCLLVSYQKLKITGATSWDREGQIAVRCRPLSRWRLILGSTIALVGFLAYMGIGSKFLPS